ncbi:MAG TPA: glycosyltransferase [Rhizomicrobium sp.]|nr:glycosyltransferase [Rhizomicrobium sp.]
MPELSLTELRARLDAAEADLDKKGATDVDQIRRLTTATLYWACQSPEGHPAPRVARLLVRAGANDAAVEFLERAHALFPANGPIALLLANASANAGKQSRALEVLEPLADASDASAALLARVAELHFGHGNIEESLRLHRRAAVLDGDRRKGVINTLMAARRGDEALQEAREAMLDFALDPATSFACYNTIARFSKERSEIESARAHLLTDLPPGSEGAIWRARLYRSEDDLEAAIAEVNSALADRPTDSELLRERAALALAQGYWGRDAKSLLAVRSLLADAPDLRVRLSQAEALFEAFGGSIEKAARSHDFSHIMSPESIFETVAGSARPRNVATGSGLVMIAHSLTAGGAERVVATTFRALHESGRFDWVKLYLIDLSPHNGTDFYLPLVGAAASDIVVLNRTGPIEAPFAWLPQDNAATAQAIFNRLQEDKPAIVHASLEPLTLFAGLAALHAGVPRIVLHTHNMRPTALRPELAAPRRWRGCYEALLGRKNVALVGVAGAAIRDYEQWLDLENASNLHVVHNGFDAGVFRPVRDAAARSALRTPYGVPDYAPLIGTAFKFRQEKQPLHWVDAACEVLKQRPDARFVMFGDGELMEDTRRHIEAKGVKANFILPGLVQDLAQRLPALDLFVLSSASEALPNVMLEAQACGVPVIARSVGGISETMSNGVTGMLVEDNTLQSLADTILRALADPAWMAAASRAGEDFVRRRFSPERMVTKLTDILLTTPDRAA